jgi:hypothetical protein
MQPIETIRYRESLFDGVSFAGPHCARAAKGAAKEARENLAAIPPDGVSADDRRSARRARETHAEAAALVGLSRSQTSNIIVGRFGVSRAVVQRVLELSRAA